MRVVIISDNDFKRLSELKEKEIQAANKKFTGKMKVHFRDERIKSFYKLCSEDFNPMLYTVKFKCYFSFYMYLYLKNHIERFEFDLDRFQFMYSKPMDVNFSEISRLSGVPINTVKSAFWELNKYGFLIHTKILSPVQTNLCKSTMLINDFFIITHDTEREKTYFYTRSL